MAIACVATRASLGVEAPAVTVEVHLANGLPAFNLVGLPEASVKEARERVRSALVNAGFEFPMRRITVNLAPADLPKQGGRYDLPIAIGILAASGQIPLTSLKDREFVGELALSGDIRHCPGLLPVIVAARRGGRELILPLANRADAELVDYPAIRLCSQLVHLVAFLHGQQPLPGLEQGAEWLDDTPSSALCLSDVIGQYQAKQALEIAAAGSHNLLMLGLPGCGKTMLASRIMGLLPPLGYDEALEVAALHSVAGLNIKPSEFHRRPFRSPHHTCSAISLVGGGSVPKPGEISLAHRGVLFLDELAEFPRKVLDCLREPMETGEVVISRAAAKLTFLSRFQLVAAMNPSPCGSMGPGSRSSPDQINRYLGRLSGPFLDRFDLSIEVPPLPPGTLTQEGNSGETSQSVAQRVHRARERQLARAGVLNAELSGKALKNAGFNSTDLSFLEQSVNRLGLSVRSFHRLQRVARTIADLENSNTVERRHIAQALGYRAMDRLLANLGQQLGR
ncbi:YifB family Mg chelatase-like AAA ATPase [Shewanella litorisediminis]|uniref:YifB family Mg chelatase-like AAA ATPase n=1 Tax=Shewanella litorisediminis TaxID=1173586 RepID=A0ABX7G2F5_9GAMM|nr:YifB family Mg chelatase-like AAA ATPase [Shewanella litorisediminis]MCL2917019.1 YifB family Mg chelatase-like AAA ATPase [Shewanella litorisediminis]QRH01500.1 YifB family Mg chelatase-like AAA ATPase [Shewanella litorisediminis]